MASAVPYAGKLLENRRWSQLKRGVDGLRRLPFGGIEPGERFAIHASQGKQVPEYDAIVRNALALDLRPCDQLAPIFSVCSAIVAVARCVDVVAVIPPPPNDDDLFPRTAEGPVLRAIDELRLRALWGDTKTHEQIKRWLMGPFALVLDDVVPLPEPVLRVKGALYMWKLPADVERAVIAQVG